MNSMMELMEKKTPSTKKIDKKKGMTLVEVMAAMAILSILFVAISGLMINTVKIEDKSNTLLDNTTVAKSIMTMFQEAGNNPIKDNWFDKVKPISPISEVILEVNFDTIEEMKQSLVNYKNDNSDKKYTSKIVIKKIDSKDLYYINVKIVNNTKNEDIDSQKSKELYINRE